MVAVAGAFALGAVVGNARRAKVEEDKRSRKFRDGWVAGYDKGHAHGLVEAEVLSAARADRLWQRIKADIANETERETPDSVGRSY